MLKQPPPPELLDKICFAIHWACVKVRRLIHEGRHQQAADLADAVEHIPCYLPAWRDEFLAIVVDAFQRYQAAYGGEVFDYVGLLVRDFPSFQRDFGNWRGRPDGGSRP